MDRRFARALRAARILASHLGVSVLRAALVGDLLPGHLHLASELEAALRVVHDGDASERHQRVEHHAGRRPDDEPSSFTEALTREREQGRELQDERSVRDVAHEPPREGRSGLPRTLPSLGEKRFIRGWVERIQSRRIEAEVLRVDPCAALGQTNARAGHRGGYGRRHRERRQQRQGRLEGPGAVMSPDGLQVAVAPQEGLLDLLADRALRPGR